MNIEKYTERARGFVQSAQSLAVREGHQQFSSLHMLKVLLDDNEGLASGLIDRAGGNSRAILKTTEDALNKLPKVSGSGAGQVYLAPELARAFDAAEKAFGTVTILVNNAGVVGAGRAVELPEEEWRRILSTNLDAVFFTAQEAARRMLAAGKKGAIVNIASVLGFGVDKGVIAYATAKAGVIQLTKALALELAYKGIRVNAIAPGWIVTDLNRDYLQSERGSTLKREIPIGRFGEERDLDGPLLLLVSDAGRFVTGATIVADGGQMIALRG